MDPVFTTIRAEGARAVVAVQGDLDVFSAAALREHFASLIDTGHHHVVVDLDGVEFLDSTGIGALVAVLKRARAHDGSLRLVCTNARIVTLLGVTVPRALPTYRNLAEAGVQDPAALTVAAAT